MGRRSGQRNLEQLIFPLFPIKSDATRHDGRSETQPTAFPRRIGGRWSVLFALALLGIAIGRPLDSAETNAATHASHRPKIGLVLAGGGARGLGHLGVLRLLEELHVPVDYVAGTSMGAIIGGLYSSGYSSQELTDWMQTLDWDLLLSDEPPRQERGYRTKVEEQETPKWIEMGFGTSCLKVPNALVSGQNLLVALREKTTFVDAQSNFNELPVPFRAVATDLETGDMVVLDHGSLAAAMRASMAVPGEFAPYAIDGRVLIDGFVSRNLPVSVARDMEADVIIAVDVRADLLPADKLTNPVIMASQMVSILSQRDTLEQLATLKDRDVPVRLKLPGYGVTSFRDGKKLADLGYQEAQEAREALAALALPPAEYAALQEQRRSLRRELPVIAAVEVRGSGKIVESAIRGRLKIKTGTRLDPDRLRQGLERVQDLGYFKSVDYHIEDRPEGKVVVVETASKPWGRISSPSASDSAAT